MLDFFFYLFSALTVLTAFLVAVSPNAVNSAMYMILSFIGMAALFLLLDAFFLAVLQVLVYAGAVMVLFLFIIMLLDVERASKIRPSVLTLAASLVAFGLLVVGIGTLFLGGDAPTSAMQPVPEIPMADGSDNPMEYATASRSFGYGLFTKYMLPFQVTGFLLLSAMIGVIVLSKRLGPSGQEEPEPVEAK
ncbi:MAG: NADH-quinone oxidoreductase subunit J [Verrucomicrobiota bacterium]